MTDGDHAQRRGTPMRPRSAQVVSMLISASAPQAGVARRGQEFGAGWAANPAAVVASKRGVVAGGPARERLNSWPADNRVEVGYAPGATAC